MKCGPYGVVVMPPALDHAPGSCEALEPVPVQALVPQRTVEAFDERVLHRLAWLDVAELNAARTRPGIEDPAGELTTVVADINLRPAPLLIGAAPAPRPQQRTERIAPRERPDTLA